MPRKRQYATEDLKNILEESMVWPEGLESMHRYERLHDDHDGTMVGRVAVTISEDGDAWLSTHQRVFQSLRFRTRMGGGRSVRVRNALLMLAFAIKLEEDEEAEAKGRK